jgi:hypothetical protein
LAGVLSPPGLLYDNAQRSFFRKLFVRGIRRPLHGMTASAHVSAALKDAITAVWKTVIAALQPQHVTLLPDIASWPPGPGDSNHA